MGEDDVMGITLRNLGTNLGSLPALALCIIAAPAFAQTTAPAPTSKETTGLDEIVVTEEKRESTVQKTPVSITAISEAELQARGLSDFRSIAQETPGVSMKTSGPGQSEFEMR